MSKDPRFEEWLATPAQTGRLVEGVYIYGNAWVGGIRFANSVYNKVALPDEFAISREWSPADFAAELPQQEASLQLQMKLTFSGLRPDVITAFDGIPPEYLAGVSWIRLYTWIVPGAQDVPLVLPPPRYAITQVDMTSSSIELQCSGPLLPNWRAGRIYTIEEFPGLSVL